MPKVPIANLFHLLEASGRALQTRRRSLRLRTDAATSSRPSPPSSPATSKPPCARGLPRLPRAEERLAGIRGRVNLPAQRRLAGLPLPIECRLRRVHRGHPTQSNPAWSRPACFGSSRCNDHDSTGAAAAFDGRLEEATTATNADLRSETTFTRLNEHCRPAERLARIVLAGSSLLDAVGAAGAAVFLIDMNKVFEEFVESRLRRYLLGRLIVHGQWPDRLDTDGSVRIRPDLVFGPDRRDLVRRRQQVQGDRRRLRARGRLLPATRLHGGARPTRGPARSTASTTELHRRSQSKYATSALICAPGRFVSTEHPMMSSTMRKRQSHLRTRRRRHCHCRRR